MITFVIRSMSLQPFPRIALPFRWLMPKNRDLKVFKIEVDKAFISWRTIPWNFGQSKRNTHSENQHLSCNGESSKIVGLGNHPYPETRHSVGMLGVDKFAHRLGLQWEKCPGRLHGSMCKTALSFDRTEDEKAQIILFKPKALMNISGDNVAKAAHYFGVKADTIYLVHDELDLPVGACAMKNGGSARGHRGVQSCIGSLKSHGLWSVGSPHPDAMALPRLRLGIGRPAAKSEVVTYVLSPVPSYDLEAISSAIDNGINLLLKHMAARYQRLKRIHGDGKDDT